MPAISPAINPQAIVGNKPKTFQSFQKFISGGRSLGNSVVTNVSNNIVGFQRASVRPATSDMNSIVNTISSNILTHVDNSIQNATNIINKTTDNKIQQSQNEILNLVEQITPQQNNQVTQLETSIQNIQNQTTNIVEKITQDYKKRVEQVDAAKPNNLLSNFIELYKTAIDFIKFFGDRRNIDGLRNNLIALRESFTESFEVAKLIRTTILKIVNQLSSLPKVGPGSSSGIDIDVNVPGGGLRRTLPRGASPGKMRGRLGMLGLGLGGAALGGAAINALSGSGNQVQPGQPEQSIPGQILDTFSVLISRFANAVDDMINGSKTEKSGSPTSSGTKSKKTGPGSPGAPGGPKPGQQPGKPSDVTVDSPEEKAWLQTIRKVEGTSDSGGYNKLVGGEVVPELSKMTLQEVYDMGMKGRIGEGTLPSRFGGRKVKYGADSHAMGAYQFKPQTMLGIAKNLGLDPKTTLFSPEIQDKLALANLESIGVDPSKRATASTIEKAGTQWAGLTPYYGQTGRTAQQSLEIYNQYYKKTPSVKKGIGGEDLPDWALSPQKREELKLATKTVSQPPPSQAEEPTITTLPLDLSALGGQKQSKGPIPTPSRGSSPGPQVPYIPSSNPENFLVLYSKIVYNIVDG